MPKCPIHRIDLVSFCPACRGSVRSKRKAASSRENGKLGGRPPKARSSRRRATTGSTRTTRTARASR